MKEKQMQRVIDLLITHFKQHTYCRTRKDECLFNLAEQKEIMD